MPPISAAGTEPTPARASSERSLTPAQDARLAAPASARPRSKGILVAVVLAVLFLIALALVVKQKLGPQRLPGTALHPLPALAAPAGSTK